MVGGPVRSARCRIVVPITARSPAGLVEEVRSLAGHPVDLIEWRVDALTGPDGSVAAPRVAPALHAVMEVARRPVLATIRTAAEGGAARIEAAEYARWVTWLAARVDAVDVEVDRGVDLPGGATGLVSGARRLGAVVIGSHHDFSGTPPEPEVRDALARQEAVGVDIAKVAYMARVPQDLHVVLKAQMWARENLEIPVIGLSMGPLGSLSRICGMRLGCAATFATVGAASAPGQFSADQVRAALDVLES